MINYLCGVILFLGLHLTACKDVSKPVDPAVEPAPIETVTPTGPDIITHEPEPEPVVVTPAPPASTPVQPVIVSPGTKSPEELFSVAGVKLTDASASQKTKYEKALAIVLKVIKDPAFKKAILAHKRMDGSSGFENTSDSPSKVYQKLLEGSETYKKAEIDREADLEVRFYYAANSTVGYTYPNVGYIKVNTKFFNGYTPSSVAANFIHEYLHKLGYGHDSSATARRPKSVPYGIGSIMRSVGKKYE